MAFTSLAKLHEKALTHAKRLRSLVDSHEEVVGTIVGETVRTLETAAGGATGAALDYYLSPSGSTGLPEGMIGSVPVVPVAAVVGKLGAFLLMKSKSNVSRDIHAYSNGLGAWAVGCATLRMLQAQAA